MVCWKTTVRMRHEAEILESLFSLSLGLSHHSGLNSLNLFRRVLVKKESKNSAGTEAKNPTYSQFLKQLFSEPLQSTDARVEGASVASTLFVGIVEPSRVAVERTEKSLSRLNV